MKLQQLIHSAVKNQSIPDTFPHNVLAQANDIQEPLAHEKRHRKNLCKLPLVTIDGDTSQDFDDAVYCERWRKNGWYLVVAIADVAHYVTPNSPLDNEAQLRGNSVYFPEFCIPMLPKNLSNNICSLKPNVDRLSMVAHLYINASGKLCKYKFENAVIHSHARLTYIEVQNFLDGGTFNHAPSIKKSLKNLHDLYRVLSKVRRGRHALEFESNEQQFIIKNGCPVGIQAAKRGDSHKMIEEAMIIANVASAMLLSKHNMPYVSRFHNSPQGKKLEKLEELVRDYKLPSLPSTGVTPEVLSRYIQSLPSHLQDDFKKALLQTSEKAVYCCDNEGHFGLALDFYAHFTSPIRRYPDVIVHRMIYTVLKLPGWQRCGYRMKKSKLSLVCQQTTKTEIRANNATTKVHNQLLVSYYKHQNHKNPTYTAEVVAIHKKTTTGGALKALGLYTTFDNGFGRAYVPLANFKNGFYILEKNGNSLLNRQTNQSIKIGTKLQIKLAGFNIKNGQIKAIPIEKQTPTSKALSKMIGQVYSGTIKNISRAGFEISLPQVKEICFSPIGFLKDDYYRFNKTDKSFTGTHTRRVLKKGDSVKVKVVRISQERQNLIVELI